jgi:hypothetical protein
LSVWSIPIDQSLPATVKGYQQYVVLIRGPALGGVVVALHFDTASDFKNSRGAAGRACGAFAGRIICGTGFLPLWKLGGRKTPAILALSQSVAGTSHR